MANFSRNIHQVPDHEILRLIGRGSYGEIWLARNLTGHWRAVKLVHRERFEDEQTYLREFRGITRFEPISRDDPHFADILHVGNQKPLPSFIFLELADDLADGPFNPVMYEAKTLRKVMEQRGRLSATETLSLGCQLARGLEALHRHGLIHRDIEPSNIIFIRGEPKLADLELLTLAGEGSFVGTEGYVAPEGPYSARPDLYSLGKVLYEVVSGKDRFDFPELPTAMGVGVENTGMPGLNRIILKACASDPKLRFESASEMAAALNAVAAGRKAKTRPLRWRAMAGIVLPVAALALFPWGREKPVEIPPKKQEAIFLRQVPGPIASECALFP